MRTAEYPSRLGSWQAGALGRAVAQAEAQLLAVAMDDVFGLELLQLGEWGRARELLHASRTRRQCLIGPGGHGGEAPDIVARPASLPIASGTIDAVVLPHCLEIEADPHAVLREADRVLLGEGHLIVLGFNPWSLWGLRAAASRTGFPPGFSRLLSEGRLRDWLVLLGYEVSAVHRYLYVLPVEPRAGAQVPGMLRRGLFNPLPAGGYLLKARKRVYALTPIRPRRRDPRALLGGLVNPSA
jgi:SAM-dependent methyltransferase